MKAFSSGGLRGVLVLEVKTRVERSMDDGMTPGIVLAGMAIGGLIGLSATAFFFCLYYVGNLYTWGSSHLRRSLAEKGSPRAQYALGIVHSGRGGDNEAAARWHLKAAEQGHAKAHWVSRRPARWPTKRKDIRSESRCAGLGNPIRFPRRQENLRPGYWRLVICGC